MTVEREDKAHGLVHQCIRWDYVRKSEVSSFRWLVLSDRTRDNRHKLKYKKHVLAVSVSKHWNRMSKELVGSLLLEIFPSCLNVVLENLLWVILLEEDWMNSKSPFSPLLFYDSMIQLVLLDVFSWRIDILISVSNSFRVNGEMQAYLEFSLIYFKRRDKTYLNTHMLNWTERDLNLTTFNDNFTTEILLRKWHKMRNILCVSLFSLFLQSVKSNSEQIWE